MDTILYYPILLPIAAGLFNLLIPRRIKFVRETITILVSLATIGLSVFIFTQPGLTLNAPWLELQPGLQIPFTLHASAFARLTLVVVSIFSLLVGLYSIRLMENHPRRVEYYAYYLIALGVTCGAVLADNLVIMLFFWELHGLFLFLMAGLNGDEAVPASARTLIFAGIGDLALVLGISLLWLDAGTLSIQELSAAPLALTGWLPGVTFLLLLVGVLAKSGLMPLHSWVTAISTITPMTVMSYFTSLDKMLGIYLLTSISVSLFVMSAGMGWLIMTVGAVTLLIGVLMAMAQHDYRRMLAFHSISQVGYMALGIGTGTPIGIIGGVLHLVNMVIVKGSLYLCGGAVQYRTGKTDFEDMGGLAKSMPWTFTGTLVAALAIAGVPPLNAFVSKWLVYQGILERGGAAFPLFLAVAMFGSALTLASFVKLLYSMFWGERPSDQADIKEAPALMTIPLVLLAASAIGIGLFYRPFVQLFLQPVLGMQQLVIPGLWDAGLATTLLLVSLLVGFVIYLAGRPRDAVEADVFLGGERVNPEWTRIPGTQFYGPVKDFSILKKMYFLAERGVYDIYDVGFAVLRKFSQLIYQYVDHALAEFYEETIPSLLSLLGKLLRILNSRLVLTWILWGLYLVSAIALHFSPNEAVLGVVRVIACIGMVGWCILAMVETDLLRLLVLAATSQMGLLLLGGSISGTLALSYLGSSGAALLLLALVSWFIRRRLHTTTINKLGGIAGQLPIPFALFLLAALWLSGLPPFGGFFSKYMLGVAAEEISPILGIVITGTAILTLAYLLRPIRQFLRTG